MGRGPGGASPCKAWGVKKGPRTARDLAVLYFCDVLVAVWTAGQDGSPEATALSQEGSDKDLRQESGRGRSHALDSPACGWTAV